MREIVIDGRKLLDEYFKGPKNPKLAVAANIQANADRIEAARLARVIPTSARPAASDSITTAKKQCAVRGVRAPSGRRYTRSMIRMVLFMKEYGVGPWAGGRP